MILKFTDFVNEGKLDDVNLKTKKVDEKTSDIIAWLHGDLIGFVRVEKIEDGYFMFNDMTEEKYEEMFPGRNLIYIENILVDKKFREIGVGDLLMTKAMEYVDENGGNSWLNATEYNNRLSNVKLPVLIHFYERFGYKVFETYKTTNALMYRNKQTAK